MNVAIIGGSLGGLAAGIVLRHLGHEVQIYEKSAGLMDDRGAGIVMLPETMTLLEQMRKGGACKVSVSCKTRRYLRRGGGTKAEMPMAQRFTSWGALYHTLRGAFPSDRYLPEVLTDRDCRQRPYSLPPGAVRDQWVQRLREEAGRLLPPQFVALVEHTGQPFVQAILDLSVTKMAFGRVCLLGDAAFVPRPHTAASTSKAIGNALDLARAFAN